MDGILGFIGLIVFLVLINVIFSVVGKSFSAIGRTVSGKGSFSDNVEYAFKGIGDFDAQVIDSHLDDNPDMQFKEIQVKGLFPVDKKIDAAFIVSVLDVTENQQPSPVVSLLDDFSEPNSPCFQHATHVGVIEPNQGFISWVKVGVVIPDILQPPYSGKRNLLIILRLVDVDKMPTIEMGMHDKGDPSLIWTKAFKLDLTYNEKGYLEAQEHRDEARSLALKAGVAVAMSDGSLDDSEGQVIQEWIRRELQMHTDDKQMDLKELYNSALRDAYTQAKQGDLSLSSITQRLNEIAEKRIKYDAMELCFEIMAADGHADPAEMKVIRKIGSALELDLDELEQMKDQHVVNLSSNRDSQASYEELLGIDASWNNDEIRKHLRSEFQKWNNRLNTVSEGVERDNAQKMLNAISELRKKYG